MNLQVTIINFISQIILLTGSASTKSQSSSSSSSSIIILLSLSIENSSSDLSRLCITSSSFFKISSYFVNNSRRVVCGAKEICGGGWSSTELCFICGDC